MQLFWDGISEAIRLLSAGDAQIFAATLRTIFVSSSAVLLAMLVGVPLGVFLARVKFTGNQWIVLLFRVGMALPTVFVGVLCYGLFSRRGMLGPLELLYSPWGIICGELLLATPIVVGITHGAVSALDPRVGETAWTLGANPLRRALTYLSEARIGMLLAVLTAFARCVSELGIAMMVGGNIKDQTRTLATETALEISKGEFARGMAMGTILLTVALVATGLIGWLSRENR